MGVAAAGRPGPDPLAATPYKDKWVICRQGTAGAPIVVRGVPGPAGELPIIEGNGATTRLALDYWGEQRAVIKIGGASIPGRHHAALHHDREPGCAQRRGRPTRSWTTPGNAQSYVNNAAAIWIEKGEHITIRNTRMHDSGNGLFVSSAEPYISRDILIEGNAIYDNGNVGSLFEHNTYTEALGITYQYNYFGPTKAGAGGNNLKDRSAGLVVRQNWIEGGNRQLDLVETDSATIQNSPAYRTTFVYGNVLVETDASGNRQITHYGGDNGTTSKYRKGTLHFYNNTMVSYRTDRTTLFRLSTNEERADVRNNVFYVTAAGSTLSLLDATGILDLTHNWFKPGRVATFGTLAGTINDDGTSIVGSSPGLPRRSRHRTSAPRSDSAAANAGTGLAPALLPEPAIARQYVKHLAQRGAPQRRRVRPRRVRDGPTGSCRPRDRDQQPPGQAPSAGLRRVRDGDRRPGTVCLDRSSPVSSSWPGAQPGQRRDHGNAVCAGSSDPYGSNDRRTGACRCRDGGSCRSRLPAAPHRIRWSSPRPVCRMRGATRTTTGP